MHFDELLSQVRKEGVCVIPASWAQGRASFGGLVAALVYDSMARIAGEGRSLRSLMTSFIGPVAPGVPCQIEVTVLRQGKAVTQIEGRLRQGGEVLLVLLGSFGAGRESRVILEALPRPAMPGVESCAELPFLPGIIPEFTQHIVMRWGVGHMPFTGQGGRQMGGWMRFRQPPAALTDAHIIALVDAWPPALLPHLSQPAPASSLSWTLELVHPLPELAADAWLCYQAHIDQARDGYGHTSAGIWTPEGELVALSRQTVTVFG